MTTPPPPGYTADPYAPVMWAEPTRRLSFSPRFSYDGRYGAALVAVLLGGYLLLNANVAQLAIGLSRVSAFPVEQMFFFAGQFLFAVAVIVFGFAVAPATSGRRVIAIVVALVMIIVWFALFTARMTGSAIPLPFASGFITATSFIVPLVIATGWLIIRERPPLTYLFLVLTLAGGAIPFFLMLNSVPSVAMQLLTAPLAAVIGVGIAWLARAVAAATQRMHAGDGLVDEPPAV